MAAQKIVDEVKVLRGPRGPRHEVTVPEIYKLHSDTYTRHVYFSDLAVLRS
jgi:hypothetical protein